MKTNVGLYFCSYCKAVRAVDADDFDLKDRMKLVCPSCEAIRDMERMG